MDRHFIRQIVVYTSFLFLILTDHRIHKPHFRMQSTFVEERKVKLHDWNIRPKKKASKTICNPDNVRFLHPNISSADRAPITWTVSDLAKAGCLLASPPIHTRFHDEQEMRRVYSLIYDVFRCKFTWRR